MKYTTSRPKEQKRLHISGQGMVQGVGFRPFIYRLATELKLGGWIRNNANGIEIEVEGIQANLTTFMDRLERERPPQSVLANLYPQWLNPCGYDRFEIQSSGEDGGAKSAWMLPDLATCSDCLRDVLNPQNRRYHYPFANCTQCGPRYSILKALPYDRSNTTMQNFCMCSACQAEYENPADRRFHAQPNSCPDCGPHLELWNPQGETIAAGTDFELIQQVADRIRQGEIIALKGLGGFHLMVDARNTAAIQRLRDRKARPAKPLAIMYPSLNDLRQDCWVSPLEETLLTSIEAPIVLLTPKPDPINVRVKSVAPHLSTVGAMLPYTPLHSLLLTELGFPVVATSGNRSQEPICIDNTEAISKLGSIADVFLVHNRPIARPVDDSVVRVICDRPMLLRRARGYAPFPISGSLSGQGLSATLPCLLAVGGHLKNTVAMSLKGRMLLSQHLGDLDEVQTFERFNHSIDQLLSLYQARLVTVACDTHPDYTSTQVAQTLSQKMDVPVRPIQHHYAHVLSGMVDNNLEPPVLGIAWDGTGYGQDSTIWGGEFLVVPNRCGFVRLAHLRQFSLPGGDHAVTEPRRAALGLLYEAFGEEAFDLDIPATRAFQSQELKLMRMMLKQDINAPRTSSIGRLFDAIAAITNLCQRSTFEGEAAMRLEAVTQGIRTLERYPYLLENEGTGSLSLNWQPMLSAILADHQNAASQGATSQNTVSQDSIGMIAAKFHNTLIDAMVAIAHEVGFSQVVLTGGCFQNRYLLEGAIQRLQEEGFLPFWHQHVPPNDGGLAVGQIVGAAWQLEQAIQGGAACV